MNTNLVYQLKSFFKKRQSISYNEYIDNYITHTKSFEGDGLQEDVVLTLSLRELYNSEVFKVIKVLSILLAYGSLSFILSGPLYYSLILISIGLLLILYFNLFIEKLLPLWSYYFSLKSKVNDYLKSVSPYSIDDTILREFLITDNNEKNSALAKALYENTKESWINDKALQKSNYERLIILYYLLNKKLNLIKNQHELSYLIGTLINIGESNASGKKAEALRKLNDMYLKNISQDELSDIRRYLPKARTILLEMIALIEKDMVKIDSLK